MIRHDKSGHDILRCIFNKNKNNYCDSMGV